MAVDERFSFLHQADNEYVDSLYEQFRQDPDSVETSWRQFFQGFEFAHSQNGTEVSAPSAEGTKTMTSSAVGDEFKVARLIQGYRSRGHLLATTNPIRPRKDRRPMLQLADYGLSDSDLDRTFNAGELLGLGVATLQQILNHLQKLYTENIGVEFSHITNSEVREWFRKEYESSGADITFELNTKKRILGKLNEAVVFENFLNKKYVGQKRFSLEGGENTIPALDSIINESAEMGVNEVVIGMAHRGRLNVLANILGKTYEYIFSEFEGFIEPEQTMGNGDVKYHLGFSSQVTTCNGRKVFLKLMPNPSHLEAVDAVVEGYSRAKTELFYQGDYSDVLPILIHGDAALAGQGVVYEIAQMSQLPGFCTGGTIHFVINNQIGFTTDFDDARSSVYSTAVGYTTGSPILHVNGDDAEAVVYAVELAARFRQQFHRDVYIDMVCYRKHGHNEGDEPKFTQPQLYKLINKHDNPRQQYVNKLIQSGQIEGKMAKEMESEFKELLQARLNMVKEQSKPFKPHPMDEDWKHLRKATEEDFHQSPETAVKKEALEKVIKAVTTVPEDFNALRKVERLLAEHQKLYNEEGMLSWSMAELAAYGTLMQEGNNVRLTGQDVIRGTFSHRHAALYDEKTSEPYNLLNHLEDAQGTLHIYNSLLSEYAVLAFEYGYSLSSINTLTIWEAQFGDFSNGAQVAIDQYIASGESKWQKMTGLVMLLPHGYEGQGPEHSNARPERFLQLAAELNLVVANCSTPASFFHLLRRQLAWEFRKPLVVFTPKSLLRHPLVRSKVSEFTSGGFREVLDDIEKIEKPKRVLLCTGKVYYDLLEARKEAGIDNVALVRVEQLYPWPQKQLEGIFAKYEGAEWMWVQEEPRNMGAWYYINNLELPVDLQVVSRKASASPATGYKSVHKREQEELTKKALTV